MYIYIVVKYKDMVIQICNQVTAVINLENLEKKTFLWTSMFMSPYLISIYIGIDENEKMF